MSVGALSIDGLSVMLEMQDASRLTRLEQMHFALQGKSGRKPSFGPALMGAVASVSPSEEGG